MKRFIFAKEFVSSNVNSLTNGQLSLYYINSDGTYQFVSGDRDGSDNYKNTLYFVLNNKGELLNIPINTNHFSFNVTSGDDGRTFDGEITIPEPTVDGHYTIILVKKGVKFNERNRWTASVPVKVGEDVVTITEKLAKYFIDNSTNLNITVETRDNNIDIFGKNPCEDFNIILADELSGAELTIENAKAPVLDAAWINDFAAKCASDAGYNYTYQEPNINLGYPFDVLKELSTAESEFSAKNYSMINLRFAVPRDVKTRDEVVHQTLHILMPNEKISGLTSKLTTLVGQFGHVNPL